MLAFAPAVWLTQNFTDGAVFAEKPLAIAMCQWLVRTSSLPATKYFISFRQFNRPVCCTYAQRSVFHCAGQWNCHDLAPILLGEIRRPHPVR